MSVINGANLPGKTSGVRNFAFLGEAGCGKSELAINLAFVLANEGTRPVEFFDLDMTKPLFRSRDQAEVIEQQGVTLHFQEQFMDAPTTSGGVDLKLKDSDCYTVLDIGGDYMGARAVGRYAYLLNREDTAVYYIINPYRPWSDTIERIDGVLGQILGVSHIELSKLYLVVNPNIGEETDLQTVLEGCAQVEKMVAPYIPVSLICTTEAFAQDTAAAVKTPVLSMELYQLYPWNRKIKDESKE